MATLKKIEGDELYLYMNGKVIYKRWLKTGHSKVFDLMAYDKYTLLSITEGDIDIQPEVIDYLFSHYTHLMTLAEKDAHRNFKLDARLQSNPPTSKEYMSGMYSLQIYSLAVKELMINGWDTFRLNWTRRVLNWEADKIVINRCEKCEKLARTPLARQCRFCGYDWHE
jgi:hypothetical protein